MFSQLNGRKRPAHRPRHRCLYPRLCHFPTRNRLKVSFYSLTAKHSGSTIDLLIARQQWHSASQSTPTFNVHQYIATNSLNVNVKLSPLSHSLFIDFVERRLKFSQNNYNRTKRVRFYSEPLMAKGPMRRPSLFFASVVTDIRRRTRRPTTYVGITGLRFGLDGVEE